jgi:hypothetical protein
MLLAATLVACGSPAPTAGPASAGTQASGSGGPSMSQGPGAMTSGDPGSADAATLAYGAPATRDPSLTYQPDVVFVGGGPSIVRWASADGMTWAIDRNAPGAADLKVNSVMFATSRAVGRVADIHDDGDSRVVTLAPVDLTDIVRDGEIAFERPLDLGSLSYQDTSGLPGAVGTTAPSGEPGASAQPAPSASSGALVPPIMGDGIAYGSAGDGMVAAAERVLAVPTIRLAATATPANGTLPPPVKTCPDLAIGNWSIKPCLSPGRLTLEIATKAVSGLRLGGSVTLLASSLKVKADLKIAAGQVGSSSVLLEGITGLEISITGGTADPTKDNASVKIEVPIEICAAGPPVVGLPMVGCFEAKFLVQTAFSGKNSTLEGSGAYTLDGPIGLDAGKVTGPTLGLKQSLLESLRGITLGPSGVVLAVRFKVQVGVGMPGMLAGPYATVTVSTGVTKGSSLGASLATCRGVTLNILVGGGAGLQIDLKRILPFLPASFPKSKVKIESEVNVSVFSKTQVLPDVPLCRG